MMDLTCFNWAQLVKKSSLPANAKYLALYLSTFMNYEHNVAWPSVPRIIKETGLTKPTVTKWLNYLHDEGWLTKRINTRSVMTKGGEQLQNEYEIGIPESILRGVSNLPTLDKGGQTVDQRGANCSTKGGKQLTPNNNSNNNNNNNIPSHGNDVTKITTPSANDLFEKFYAVYPRKKSKGQAEKAFKQLNPNEQLVNVMIKAVQQAKTSVEWTKDGGQFIPYPSTWIRALGWKDELPNVEQNSYAVGAV